MIFPDNIINNEETGGEKRVDEPAPLPSLIDWAVDFKSGRLAIKNGRNYKVEGAEALKVWIYKALKTPRSVYAAYSDDFGEDFSAALSTLPYDDMTLYLQTYITEALTPSPYVYSVHSFAFERNDAVLRCEFTVDTVLGEIPSETEVEW